MPNCKYEHYGGCCVLIEGTEETNDECEVRIVSRRPE
jgi:hypothetical protein